MSESAGQASPVDLYAYNHDEFPRSVPGVDTSGAHSSRPPAHLIPAPVALVPVFPEAEASRKADEVLEAAPVPVKPVPAREAAPEPARDGEFARAYVRKD